jgi:RNA polymerase sigma factor (sigma-70 family)
LANVSRLSSAVSRVRLRVASDDRLVLSVRQGDAVAFEALYERHAGTLLAFCAYMLGSTHDAEDAVQATYVSAYRAVLADSRPVAVRAWLFTIARNECVDILRRRHPTVELNGEAALSGDPVRAVELRDEIQHMVEDVRGLPENQRAALVLAEVDGLTQAEIGSVLGVRTDQVKAYIYQARSNLVSERGAREADCHEIREELAVVRGAGLLRGRLRRHVRSCAGCHEYANAVARQHRQLGALIPLAPALALKYRVLEQIIGIASSEPAGYAGGTAATVVAATAADVAGGGIKALAIKLAAGLAALGASAGVGVSVLDTPPVSHTVGLVAASRAPAPPLVASLTGPVAAGGAGMQLGQPTHGSGSGAPSLRGFERYALVVQNGSGGGSPTINPAAETPEPHSREPVARAERGLGRPQRPGQRTSTSSTGARKAEEGRQRAHMLSQQKQQERTQQRESREHERQRTRELRRGGAGGTSGTPQNPPGEEPIPVGVSRSPRTAEERQLRREEHKRAREQREREERTNEEIEPEGQEAPSG